MGNAHVDPNTWQEIKTADARGEIIGHVTAADLAYAYTWGWSTCWFHDTGDFVFPWDFNHAQENHGLGPVEYMDECLFGWWFADHHNTADVIAREAMVKYLRNRLETDGGGPIEGWSRKR